MWLDNITGCTQFDQYLDTWLEHHSRSPAQNFRHRKGIYPTEGTLKSYESILRLHIKPVVGDLKIAQLNYEEFDKVESELNNKKLSQGTIDSVKGVIAIALKPLFKEGIIPANYAYKYSRYDPPPFPRPILPKLRESYS
jgi:hypothetical protein